MRIMKMFVTILAIVVSATVTAESKQSIYTFSIVPQQSATKTARLWGPILTYLEQQTGYHFRLRTAKSIPVFEQRLLEAKPDFAYMNPYHYTIFHESSGYNAIARAKDKQIHGIIVVHKDSKINSLAELDGETLAFPSPAAFAASILTRAYFRHQGMHIIPKYVSSHDSVYSNVAKGFFIAGGGIERTLTNSTPAVRDRLRVLWKSYGYTPHAIAAHERIPGNVIDEVQAALITLSESDDGIEMLESLRMVGFDEASNSDWDDIRSLKIKELE